jgi:hypothetical protein
MEMPLNEDFVAVVDWLMHLGITNVPPEDMLQDLLPVIDDFAAALATFSKASPAASYWVLARVLGSSIGQQRTAIPEVSLQRIAMTCAGVLIAEALAGNRPPPDEEDQRPVLLN